MMTTLIGAIVFLVISALLLAKYFANPTDDNATIYLAVGCVGGVLTILVSGLGLATRGAEYPVIADHATVQDFLAQRLRG